MQNESCKSTELKRWIVTEMCWNKNWASVVAGKVADFLAQIADDYYY